ncbi:MAG: hypothetical protein HYX69_14490 [Planctomycetia bacterium]|nr:hypothetical protein [Planctomycetia bacterium]
MRNRVKIAGFILGSAATVVVLVAGSLLLAARHVPAFYAEALCALPEVQHQASDELLAGATALSSSARRRGPWYALFTEEQINGWLAVDLVRNHAELLPEGFVDPRVRIEAGRARIACGYRQAAVSTVLSISVDLYLAEPNCVALRFEGARAGALPVPMTTLVEGVAHAAERLNLRVRWRQAGGDPVALVSLPTAHDEKNVLKLDALRLRDRELYLAGRTEPVAPVESPSATPDTPQPAVAERPATNVTVQ